MENVEHVSSTRRLAVQSALAAILASTAGCACLFRRDLSPICPTAPEVSYLDGPLTIDAHCHVFNGTDLQVKEFLSRVAVGQGGMLGSAARALGELLEQLAWEVAPSGDAELQKLNEVAAALQTCTSAGFAVEIGKLRQDGYTRGLIQLNRALERSQTFRELRNKRAQNLLSVAPDSDDATRLEALAIIESLPPTAQAYRELSDRKSLTIQSFRSLSAQGLIAFVLQNFQYRYVSVHDYLSLYNRPGARVVDLMLPSMVDYDYWLGNGQTTHTPLETQMLVMQQLAIVTGGRVHGFIPFDPLRQVAHDLGHSGSDSLSLVKRAVMLHGAVGVKLYPPMGFAALGNATKDGKGFWKQNWLPGWTDRSDLGARLDDAMRSLFAWCQAEQVPLMAHTSESNGPSKEFQKLTAAEYWQLALAEFPRLRISFGHFGGSAPVEDGLARARSFAQLMSADPSRGGSAAFADAGYFVEVLSKEPQLLQQVRQLYEETSAKGDAALVNRFMYGTDWEMTLTEGQVNGYLGDFENLFAELEVQPRFKSQGLADLSAKFFGVNAARWAGLMPGEATRTRLDAFYKAHSVPKPDWAQKLDRWSSAA